jgi:cell division protease FtsH
MRERRPFPCTLFVGITWCFLAIAGSGLGDGTPSPALAQVPLPSSGDSTGPIPYSEFKQRVAERRVAELTIDPATIRGTLLDKGVPRKPVGTFTTIRVDDPGLIGELQEQGITFRGVAQPFWLRDLLTIWVLPLVLLPVFLWLVFRRLGGAGVEALKLGRRGGRVYAAHDVKVTFDDVAGVDEAKEELREVIEFLRHPEKFQRLGGKIPKGVLQVGPPGTGKTLLAKAVAGEAGVPFFSMSGSEFVEMFVGVGAARVRDLFNQAQAKAPCIIFIDELDALGKNRGANALASQDERDQTLNQLLAEMDGFDTQKGVIIMAATNRPEILDPALLRPGRFDRHVLVDRPDIRGREAILRVHARGVRLAPAVDLRVLAARTPGFAGADLANVVNEAALLAARRGKDAVGMPELEEAIDRVVAGLEKKARVMSPREREIIAHHEAGHALVAESLPLADPVHRVSIIPRGIAGLGYTIQRPLEDRFVLTRAELLDRLAVLMAGRAAEELLFGQVSTAAQNDLQRANELARSMVTEYGMSDALGPLTLERERRAAFLPNSPAPSRDYAERTTEAVDAEVRRMLDQQHERVREILTRRRGALERLGKALLEREILEGDELRALLAASDAETFHGGAAA